MVGVSKDRGRMCERMMVGVIQDGVMARGREKRSNRVECKRTMEGGSKDGVMTGRVCCRCKASREIE